MPVENGLPQYVSKHPKTKMYRYFRRPPKGVVGSAFVRSFGSKDRKTVSRDYGRIHFEAEAYFARLVSGRDLPDFDLKIAALALTVDETIKDLPLDGSLKSREAFRARLIEVEGDRARSLSDADMDRLLAFTLQGYHGTELDRARTTQEQARKREEAIREAMPVPPKPTKGAFTLLRAFDEAWKPSAKRSDGTITETKRFVTDFIKLNGNLDLSQYTRDHWAAWRAQCLELHGPGWTAMKRFSMVKTVVAETIRAGLFERKNHAGQDVTMKKPKAKKLRNEGWSDGELKELFGSDPFTVFDGKHRDAEYWVPTIIALTGARLSEVTGMQVPDVGLRHGVQTFYLAREQMKTEDSRRIIPVPTRLIDLGLLQYIATLPKSGSLFPGINSDIITKWFGRHRKSIGVDRKGCDLHGLRHHIKTILRNVGTPDVVSDYITGHASDNVGGTYGQTELKTALTYLNKVDLGVKIPKWKAP